MEGGEITGASTPPPWASPPSLATEMVQRAPGRRCVLRWATTTRLAAAATARCRGCPSAAPGARSTRHEQEAAQRAGGGEGVSRHRRTGGGRHGPPRPAGPGAGSPLTWAGPLAPPPAPAAAAAAACTSHLELWCPPTAAGRGGSRTTVTATAAVCRTASVPLHARAGAGREVCPAALLQPRPAPPRGQNHLVEHSRLGARAQRCPGRDGIGGG